MNFYYLAIFVSAHIGVMTAENLTDISWDHAVNSQNLLDLALQSDVNFIEADIVFGYLNTEPTRQQPIMAHPPATTSDISLASFLNQILDFNNNLTDKTLKKGVKLDFKSTLVFSDSLELLKSLWATMNYPVWINADIISGPLPNQNVPVDPVVFFEGCKSLPGAVLSIGWTTLWSSDARDGSYTEKHIKDMIEAIKAGSVTNPLTFPIRAGIAAQSDSIVQLDRLYNSLKDTNDVTFTIWSSAPDYVDVTQLCSLIYHFGFNKMYMDVPEVLSSRLDLSVPCSGVMTIANNLIMTVLVVFGMLRLFVH